MQIQLEAAAPRVSCGEHGVTVAAVPWARHQTGHTLFFDDQIAWLATQTSKTAITVLMRIAWRAVGAIITRVWADTEKQVDQFADLNRITARGVARAMRQDRQLHNRAPAGERTNIVDDDRFGYSHPSSLTSVFFWRRAAAGRFSVSAVGLRLSVTSRPRNGQVNRQIKWKTKSPDKSCDLPGHFRFVGLT